MLSLALLVGLGVAVNGRLADASLSPIDGQCLPLDDGAAPLVDRESRWPEGKEAPRLRALGKRLKMRGVGIEDPCADEGAQCAPALHGAFAAFDRASRATTMTTPSRERASVVVFGNSLIAADRIVNVVRRRLQEQLGDGGRGFLYVDGLAPGPRDRTSSTAEGWITTNIADFDEKPEFRGISSSVAGGVHMSAGPASSRFRLAGESEALIYAPRAGLEVRASGGTWQPVTPSLHRLSLPAGARMLELRARSAGAVVHGVVLEHEHAGVVVDTFGVAGADAMRWARVDDEVFRAGLAARDPDLVVVMLGGNEMKRIAWRQRSLAQVRDQLRAMLRRVEPSITRSCLVIGPIDAVVGERDRRGPEHDVMTQRPEMVPVNEVHRAVAFEEGCAFFDLYTAMGGKDSLVRLKEADALFYDLVHPNDRGLAVLGQLIADALLQSWAVTPQRSLADLNAEATDLLVEVAPLEAEIVGGAAHVAGEADDSILQDALLEAL